ncbi:MAG: hypothetical protein DMG07_25655, partial [Acidobacteria bacterium]
KTLFEIGTFDGRTTLNLAANSGPDSLVYTLDLPESAMGRTRLALSEGDRPYIKKGRIGRRFAGTALEKKIVSLEGDSASFAFERFFDRIDFVFVDGAHSYDYVWNDSRVAFKLLRGDHVLRAVPIPPGKHALELRFRPTTFRIGLVISLVSIAGSVLALARGEKGAR